MLSLVMNPGLPEEQRFTLTEGTFTIGRTKDNAVSCLHKSLSRKHAQVDYDGRKVRVTDLSSKNGLFVNGKRVSECDLFEGDSFRCGDIAFLVEGKARQRANPAGIAAALPHLPSQTLPSPLALDPTARRAATGPGVASSADGEQRYKDKLFLLIRASELCVSALPIDRLLEELVVLAVQVLDVDRIALLTTDEVTLELRPRIIKAFASQGQSPYSSRVVNWVVEHGSPSSFAVVSRDRTLPGDLGGDATVRGAMCVPINPGGGTLGVIYADSLSRPDCFRPDDLALLRALANLAGVMMESASLRAQKRHTDGR